MHTKYLKKDNRQIDRRDFDLANLASKINRFSISISDLKKKLDFFSSKRGINFKSQHPSSYQCVKINSVLKQQIEL